MGFKIGVEIEGIFNNEKFNPIERKLNKYYDIVYDGSLRYSSLFNFELRKELVSHVKKDKKGFFNALKHLEKLSNCDLKDFVYFNNSCGTHIHFSFDNIEFKNVEISSLYALRRRFFKKLSESNIKAKNEIKDHYFRRPYARQINKNFSWYNEKYSEFNLGSEFNGHGFEWRSINLRGVDNWKDFQELFKIVYDCLIWFEKYLNKKYSVVKKIEIEFSEEINKQIIEKLEKEEIKKEVMV